MKTLLKYIRNFALITTFFVIGLGNVFAQPFTATIDQGIASIASPATSCGSNYTFSFTTNTNYWKIFYFYNNGTAITNVDWTISGESFKYIGWNPGMWGREGGGDNAIFYCIINPTSKTITVSTTAPSCGPIITVTPTSLSSFSYVYNSGPSTNQIYTVSGTSLTANVVITPPTNYQISTDNSIWISNPSTISLSYGSGTLASTTIYVQLKAGLAVAAYNGEVITHTSTDATQKNVTCSGSVTNPPAPVLTAAVNPTVDAPFNITYPSNDTWRDAITSITVDGTTLTAGYNISSSGIITFTPSASNPTNLLQTNGFKTIVVNATGYTTANVVQLVLVGVDNKLGISTQPTAPVLNGNALAVQPIVTIQDRYGNPTASTATITANVGAGSWTIGGTNTKASINGIANFSGITSSSASAVAGATIIFTSGSLTSVTSSAFNIPDLSSITISSVSQIGNSNVEQAATKVPLSSFIIDISNSNTILNQIDFSTSGTCTTDINSLKLYYNTSNNLSTASLISTLSSSLGTGNHSFATLGRSVTIGSNYFWVTCDINPDPTAIIGHTIIVNQISNTNILFASGNKSGSVTIGGTQTIIATTRITYYSRATGNWNSNTTWSTAGCGEASVGAGIYPTATDNVIICSSNNVTANIDIVTTGTVTVQNSGTITLNNNIEVDAIIDAQNGSTITWPNTLEIGQNANIIYNGSISAGSTTLVYQDAYGGVDAGKITATGTMSFNTVKGNGAGKGGSLKATSIAIGTYGENETGVDMAFDGPTTINTYRKYGYTYFKNGTMTFTTTAGINSGGPDAEIVSDGSNLHFDSGSALEVKGSSVTIDVQHGNVTFDGGIESIYNSGVNFKVIADNVYMCGTIKVEPNADVYFESNLIQTCNVTINQNSSNGIYVKGNWDSDGYGTNLSTANAKLKIEGNATFDNFSSTALNSNASLIILGDAYIKGGTQPTWNGSLYAGGVLKLDEVRFSFQGSARGYVAITNDSATFVASGLYETVSRPWNSNQNQYSMGNHLRGIDNNYTTTGNGIYASYSGGEITSSAFIADISTAVGAGLDIEPENWTPTLPIELIYFGIEDDILKWITATEINNDFFTLYRSIDGINFIPIYYTNGAGNNNSILEYTYIDNFNYSGLIYYKLSQTDYNGESTFSKIIAIHTCNINPIYIFKDSYVIVNFKDLNNQVIITTVDGKLIYKENFFNIESANILLPFFKNNKSIYIISTITDKNIISEKFVR